jgi:hypothetical protein
MLIQTYCTTKQPKKPQIQAQTLQIMNKTEFLYEKKEQLNKKLYHIYIYIYTNCKHMG